MLTAANNPDLTLEFLNTNYMPYFRTTSFEKKSKGVLVSLPDGSGFYVNKGAMPSGCTNTVLYFCVDYKKCTDAEPPILDGKNVFMFYTGAGVGIVPYLDDRTREDLVRDCTSRPFNCSTLIMHDGWEIKEDYPW
jgi:hypothetical protein